LLPGYYYVPGSITYNNYDFALDKENPGSVIAPSGPLNFAVSAGENVIRIRFEILRASGGALDDSWWNLDPAKGCFILDTSEMTITAGAGGTITNISAVLTDYHTANYTITVNVASAGYLSLSGHFGLKMIVTAYANASANDGFNA
jgi:hypothetical protein